MFVIVSQCVLAVFMSSKKGKRPQKSSANTTFYLEVLVPKTNGRLGIDIRRIEKGPIRGLFVHGFISPCKAEDEGLIHLDDELIAINRKVVKDGSLESVIAALQSVDPAEDYVLLRLKRHNLTQRKFIAQERLKLLPPQVKVERILFWTKILLLAPHPNFSFVSY
jgi:hypothetical protein